MERDPKLRTSDPGTRTLESNSKAQEVRLGLTTHGYEPRLRT